MSAESHDADKLPSDVTKRFIKRADAEQNRHVNLQRIADHLEQIHYLISEHAAEHKQVTTVVTPPKHPLLMWIFGEFVYPLWEFIKPNRQGRTPTDEGEKQS